MLSDEEKQAIDIIKNEIKAFETVITAMEKEIDDKDWLKKNILEIKEDILVRKTLLNLIEKQSKEIEHQIEKRANQRNELAILNVKQVEFNKLVNTVNSYKGQFKRQQKEIEELKEERKSYAEEYIHNNPWLYKQLNENYILRVESEQRERKAYIKGTNDAHELCNKKWEDKIKAKIEEVDYKMIAHQDVREAVKQVLQSLLEKE